MALVMGPSARWGERIVFDLHFSYPSHPSQAPVRGPAVAPAAAGGGTATPGSRVARGRCHSISFLALDPLSRLRGDASRDHAFRVRSLAHLPIYQPILSPLAGSSGCVGWFSCDGAAIQMVPRCDRNRRHVSIWWCCCCCFYTCHYHQPLSTTSILSPT